MADRTIQMKKKSIETFSENLLIELQSVLKGAMDILKCSDEAYELLKETIRFITVKIPVLMDSGKTEIW